MAKTIYLRTERMTIAAAVGIITSNFTLEPGRGTPREIEFVLANDTIATVDGQLFSAAINNNVFINNDAAIIYSPLFNGLLRIRHPLPYGTEGNMVLNITFNNDVATAVVFFIRVYYEADV